MKVRLTTSVSRASLNGIVDAGLYEMDGQFVVTSDVETIRKLVQDYQYHFFDVKDGGDESVDFKLFDFNSGKNDIRLDELMRNVYLDGYSYIGVKILKVLLVRHSEPVEVEPVKQRRFTVGWAG